MKVRQVSVICCTIILGGLVAACGGDDDPRPLLPQLAGTPLATATPIECGVPSPLELPAEFPSDLAAPPNYLVESIQSSPYLRVTGRLKTPPDEILLRTPMELLEAAIADNSPGWTFGPNQSADALDHTFTHTDGRSGRYTAGPIRGCRPDELELTYEITWVTS
jgi:hypothetical protein